MVNFRMYYCFFLIWLSPQPGNDKFRKNTEWNFLVFLGKIPNEVLRDQFRVLPWEFPEIIMDYITLHFYHTKTFRIMIISFTLYVLRILNITYHLVSGLRNSQLAEWVLALRVRWQRRRKVPPRLDRRFVRCPHLQEGLRPDEWLLQTSERVSLQARFLRR